VLVERTADGDRRFVGFRPGDATYADTCLPAADAEAALADAAMLVTGSLGLAVAPTRDAILAAVAHARRRAIPLVVDVNLRDVFWERPADADTAVRDELVPFADTVKASRDEAVRLFATADPQAIAARYGIRAVLVTDGRNGCTWSIANERGTTPAFAVAEVDATGAGDAFLAGYLHAALTGARASEAVRFGSACGAIVAGAVGAMAPQPDGARVRAFLAARTA
jgi:sugar/nucleoside kinase (ribokinase family)